MCYLVNKYSDREPLAKLYPKDPKQRANVDRMLFFDIGTLYKNIVDYFVREASPVYSQSLLYALLFLWRRKKVTFLLSQLKFLLTFGN